MNTKDAKYKTRDFELNVKAADVADDGTFSGYASVFDNVDSYRERVQRGAFLESLAERQAKGRALPILWQHDGHKPIGYYPEIGEDDRGLKVTGRLLVKSGVPQADEAFALMKHGVVSGLSIGYYVMPNGETYDKDARITTLTRLNLVEASLVTFPANDDARIDTIKSKLAHGGLPTLPEFEKLLRDAGFSKTQAAVVANRGLSHLLLRSESGSGGETRELLAVLRDFKP